MRKSLLGHGFRVLGCLALFCLVSPGFAAVIEVDDDGVQCPAAGFGSVAVAVAAAAAGDTVLVCDGTYIEPQITITQSVTLTSLNGPAVTKIEGNGGGSYVILIVSPASDVVIEQLDLSNPNNVVGTDNIVIGSTGGGVSRITIQRNVIHRPRDITTPDCTFTGALGIGLNDAEDVLIERNTIRDIINECAVVSSGFRAYARGIFVSGFMGGNQIDIRRNVLDNISGQRAMGINVVRATDNTIVWNNDLTNIFEGGGSGFNMLGSFGVEVDTSANGQVRANRIDGVATAVRLATAANFIVTNNIYTNLIPGGFAAFGIGANPHNALMDNVALNNFLCGNFDDPAGDYLADAGSIGNTFPNGPAFPGNFECNPLVVEMASMSAEVTSDGVVVRWSTSSEIDTVGFRVYRSRELDKREGVELLTLQPIPSMGDEFSGADYELADTPQHGGRLYYWIEDIDSRGQASRHGPIAVDVPGTRTRPTGRTR